MSQPPLARSSRAIHAVIRVLVVDDHRLVADAMERLLAQEDDIAVVGTLGTVAGLRTVVNAPDVVLMDYVLADGTGAEATRIVKARWPRARVLMLTAHGGDEAILESVQAGADGYLTKDRAVREVVAAVRAVRAGAVLLPPAVVRAIAKRIADGPPQAPLSVPLTGRELEVLRELAHGRSGRAIAADLGLSAETIRTHVQAIRRKLGARTRLEAVAIALQRKLVETPGR